VPISYLHLNETKIHAFTGLGNSHILHYIGQSSETES
jgi:hypothetical protein